MPLPWVALLQAPQGGPNITPDCALQYGDFARNSKKSTTFLLKITREPPQSYFSDPARCAAIAPAIADSGPPHA
jgi:hypothetical protein